MGNEIRVFFSHVPRTLNSYKIYKEVSLVFLEMRVNDPKCPVTVNTDSDALICPNGY